MSLSRAFTTRRIKLGGDGEGLPFLPRRSNTTKNASDDMRSKISAPVELIHTTNMLSYNAPDLPNSGRIASGSTTASKSEDDSDSFNTDSTPPTSPDVDRNGSISPEPNHLTCYFEPSNTMASKIAPPPAIPQRSPSHTKKTSYDALARQAQASRLSRDSERTVSSSSRSTGFSRSASTSTQASSLSQPETPPNKTMPSLPASVRPPKSLAREQHPFGQELAQVTELAEEFAGSKRSRPVDDEEAFLESKGLVKFSAEDYIASLQSLTASFFPERKHAPQSTPLWI